MVLTQVDRSLPFLTQMGLEIYPLPPSLSWRMWSGSDSILFGPGLVCLDSAWEAVQSYGLVCISHNVRDRERWAGPEDVVAWALWNPLTPRGEGSQLPTKSQPTAAPAVGQGSRAMEIPPYPYCLTRLTAAPPSAPHRMQTVAAGLRLTAAGCGGSRKDGCACNTTRFSGLSPSSPTLHGLESPGCCVC